MTLLGPAPATDPSATLDAGLADNATMRINAALLALALDHDADVALQLRLMLDLEVRDGRIAADSPFADALRQQPDAAVAAAARRVTPGEFERAVADASRATAHARRATP